MFPTKTQSRRCSCRPPPRPWLSIPRPLPFGLPFQIPPPPTFFCGLPSHPVDTLSPVLCSINHHSERASWNSGGSLFTLSTDSTPKETCNNGDYCIYPPPSAANRPKSGSFPKLKLLGWHLFLISLLNQLTAHFLNINKYYASTIRFSMNYQKRMELCHPINKPQAGFFLFCCGAGKPIRATSQGSC